jgi:hypothetical protein
MSKESRALRAAEQAIKPLSLIARVQIIERVIYAGLSKEHCAELRYRVCRRATEELHPEECFHRITDHLREAGSVMLDVMTKAYSEALSRIPRKPQQTAVNDLISQMHYDGKKTAGEIKRALKERGIEKSISAITKTWQRYPVSGKSLRGNKRPKCCRTVFQTVCAGPDGLENRPT